MQKITMLEHEKTTSESQLQVGGGKLAEALDELKSLRDELAAVKETEVLLTAELEAEKEKVSKQDILLIEVRERCTIVCENERVLLEALDIRQEEARLAAERVEQLEQLLQGAQEECERLQLEAREQTADSDTLTRSLTDQLESAVSRVDILEATKTSLEAAVSSSGSEVMHLRSKLSQFEESRQMLFEEQRQATEKLNESEKARNDMEVALEQANEEALFDLERERERFVQEIA